MKNKRSTIVWKTQHDFQYDDLNISIHQYDDWIKPHTYKSLAENKTVLDAGSGPGVQARLFAEYASSVTCVDLESIETTINKTKDLAHKIHYIKDDISTMKLMKEFDVVCCVGVIHHTDDPEITFNNLAKHTKSGGITIMWVYSKEGNFLVRKIIEPLRKKFLSSSSHKTIWSISVILNFLIFPFSHILYRSTLFKNFPYFKYFQYARKMTFRRNALNIYDKLNCHQQHFISKEELENWYNKNNYKDIKISNFLGTSWRVSGRKR